MNSTPQTIFEIDAGISLSHKKHLKIINKGLIYILFYEATRFQGIPF